MQSLRESAKTNRGMGTHTGVLDMSGRDVFLIVPESNLKSATCREVISIAALLSVMSAN